MTDKHYLMKSKDSNSKTMVKQFMSLIKSLLIIFWIN